MHLSKFLENQPKWLLIALAILFVVFIGVIDVFILPEISFAIFYFIPVSITTWYVSEAAGVMTSVASAIAWFIANETFGKHVYAHPLIPYWNAAVRLALFLTLTYLLSEWRSSLEREKNLARIDEVTGVSNRQLFYELAALELKRAWRYGHPLTIVSIDMDNFSKINNSFGKKIGNSLLKRVAKTLQGNIRETDLLARLGSDEFVLLLSGTGYEPSQAVLERLQNQLMEAMKEMKQDVTFSIGAVTLLTPPHSVEEMLQKADYIMYTVKNSGKNRLEHKVEF